MQHYDHDSTIIYNCGCVLAVKVLSVVHCTRTLPRLVYVATRKQTRQLISLSRSNVRRVVLRLTWLNNIYIYIWVRAEVFSNSRKYISCVSSTLDETAHSLLNINVHFPRAVRFSSKGGGRRRLHRLCAGDFIRRNDDGSSGEADGTTTTCVS